MKMTKEIVIEPVTRIEGHAKVAIQLDDQGNVADAKMHVVELRGFEKFCKGRMVEELPRITPRICGVCPWAHHIASAKATDAVFGVKIPEAARKIRELLYMAEMASDRILHFWILSGPDFVMGPTADYKDRNVFGVLKANPEVAKKVVHARHLGTRIAQLLSGKAIHPAAAVPGGWSRPLKAEEIEEAKSMAKEMHEFSLFSMKFAKENIFPKYIDLVKNLAVFNTGFLGTVMEDGGLSLYDGKLRMMQPDGSHEDFAPEDYLDHIAELVEPWSYMKFPYNKKAGKMTMDLENPVGVYRVNALARINVVDKIPTPLAQKELEEFRSQFGRPAQATLLFHWARLIELLYCTERLLELLDEPDITSTDIRTHVTPRAARGIGSVEASRGTLIHDYETDEKGIVKELNLLVATVQNNAAMNIAVKKTARDLIKGGKYDQGILNQIEMVIRPYDPCLSCGTHTLQGKLPVKLEIYDSAGQLTDTVTNC
jgi:F420-non-reducing hydrogenase large subunit